MSASAQPQGVWLDEAAEHPVELFDKTPTRREHALQPKLKKTKLHIAIAVALVYPHWAPTPATHVPWWMRARS